MSKLPSNEPKIELSLSSAQMQHLVETYQRIVKSTTEAEAQQLLAEVAVSQVIAGLPKASSQFAAEVARILGGAQ